MTDTTSNGASTVTDMTEEMVRPEPVKAKKGLSRGSWIAIGFVGVVGVVISMGYFGYSQNMPLSSLATTPMLDDTPGGPGQAQNPAYQQTLETANDQNAARALENQNTFLATPEGLMTPVETPALGNATPEFAVTDVAEQRPTVTAVPAPILPRPAAAAPAPQEAPVGTAPDVAAAPPPPAENPYTTRILAQMTQVAQARRPPESAAQAFQLATDVAAASGDGAAVADGPAQAGGAASTEPAEIIVAPGTILYGETLTSTSSDNAAPVVVEITTGPHKGAKLIGAFEVAQGSERMVVQFNQMTLASGETVRTSAYAVDGRTAETAVASDVDQRYLHRYGPVFAAAFVGGFGQAAGRPSSTVTEEGIAFSSATLQQSALAGLGAAASTISSDLAQQAPKGALITLQAGWPVGILFVAPAAR